MTYNLVTKEPSLIVIYQGNSSLSNCRVSSSEADFTVRKFKDGGELRADNTGHRLLWTGKRKVLSQYDECLVYGEDYMEKEWDNNTIVYELLLLELK
jgi:hypothetical protein